MKLTKEHLKIIIKEEIDSMLTLEMFDTGSVDGTSLAQKKALCEKAGGEWVSEDPTGRYGHCSKSIAEELTPRDKKKKKKLKSELDDLEHK